VSVTPNLSDRFYGCLIGGAIGDALGAPVEGRNYWDIRREHGRVADLLGSRRSNANGRPGGVTDDTALRSYVAATIGRKGGRIRPEDLAAFWIERGNSRHFWANERAVFERLSWGMNPWDTGRGAQKCATASMAIAPVGLVNAGDPGQAYQDGYVIGAMVQDDEERDAAGAFAAAIATAFVEGATLATVVDATMRTCGFLVQRAIELALDLRRRTSSPAQFTEHYYEQLTDWRFPRPAARLNDVPAGYPLRNRYYSGTSLELIPVAFALMDYTDGDVNEAMVEGANFGRDCDTIATFAGCLGGALAGANALRPDWVAACERDNDDLFAELTGGDPRATSFRAMADALVAAYAAERGRLAGRVAAMGRLLGV
jgi:ADP-ribosylglycohydrolase